jgi:hypothetical protein
MKQKIFFLGIVAITLTFLFCSHRERVPVGSDTYGEAELAGDEDPSFESIAHYFPALQHSREVIGIPAHPHDIGLREDGSLEFTDNASAADARVCRFQIGEPPLSFAADQTRVIRRLLDGWLPVVIITYKNGSLVYEQIVFGYSDGFRTDSDLSAFVRFRLENLGEKAKSTAIRAVWKLARTEHKVQLTILPGEAAAVCWRLPYDLRGGKLMEEISGQMFDTRLAEVKEFWQNWISKGMRVSLPEARVAQAWKAWLCYSSINVDQKNDRYEAHDGVGFYEAIFGYSAALYAHALDIWGRHGEAQKVLATLLSYQNKDGLYTQNYGLPDHGALLFALAEHYRLTRDMNWLRGVAPDIVAAGEWILSQREAARRDRKNRTAVAHGLIRFRPYCDYPDPAIDYYADAYTCRGLEEAATALGWLNDPIEKRFKSEAAEYRKDLLTSMNRAVIKRNGLKILPLEPETHRLLKSTNYRAGGYYGLVASMLLESGFLEPKDKRAFWITDFMEKQRGLILGLCEFDGGIDHAYTYGYLMSQLQREEVRRVLLGFYAMLAYGMSRETYSGVECTQIKTGQNALTLPHLYSASQQLRLLRMLLVRETDDCLLLDYGIPRTWLAQGNKVSLQNGPTHFGHVSFEMISRINEGEVAINIDPPKSGPQIRLRLRSPLKKPIVAVYVDGRSWKKFSGDVIDLGRPIKRILVQVNY